MDNFLGYLLIFDEQHCLHDMHSVLRVLCSVSSMLRPVINLYNAPIAPLIDSMARRKFWEIHLLVIGHVNAKGPLQIECIQSAVMESSLF